MRKYLLFIVLIIAMSGFVNGQIRYVTSTGAGLKNGTDWLNAYDNTQLQIAIEEVAVPAVTEVWVAAGTYKPGILVTDHFSMKSDVAIYGGFEGSEISLALRNPTTNVTILSGEIGLPEIITDNCMSVIYNSAVSSTAILDGFTIEGGYNGIGVGGSGAGIFNYASSPTINNCIITGNTASFGAGVYNTALSSPMITNCIITNNSARRGGGICNDGSSPNLINCKITNNIASIDGGGVINENSSAPIFINCTIAGNTAATYGGGVYNTDTAISTLNNSIIWGNAATLGGSQIYVETGSAILDYSCYADGIKNVDVNTGGTFTPTNSIVMDPQFVVAGGIDFLIAGNSPCVDAGLDSYNTLENDLRGSGFGRKLAKADGSVGIIDMGAYEYKFGVDPVGSITYTWTGTTDTDWNNAGNWSPATIPSAADEAMFAAGATNYPVIISAITCYNLTIETGAILTINTKGNLSVTNALTNNGTMTLQSDATGTGSLIAGNAMGTGITNAESYMTANAWHMVSSPVSGQTIAGFLTSPTNVTNIETIGTSRGMMDYSPAMDMWNALFTNETLGNMGGGKGFSILLQGPADASVVYSGSLQAGPQSVGTVLDKWNCVGNPYTSAIGISSNTSAVANFLASNASNLDLMYGVYVWDKSYGGDVATGQYTAISNVPSPILSDANLQPGQAFMVKMKPTVDALSFSKSMQIHSTGAETTKELWPTIKLSAMVNSQKSSTIVAFNSKMTNGLDFTYDAGLFKGGSELAVYTRLVQDNGFSFAIQALPDNEYNTMIIPVGIDSKSGGEVVFSAELFNLPILWKAILEDKLTNTFTDLAKNNTYTATIDANTSAFDRFQIHTTNFTGASYVWTGTIDTDWNTAGNWTPAGTPGIKDAASIPAGVTNYPVIGSAINCFNITIDAGATFMITPTGAVTLSNAMINNGTLWIQSAAAGTGSLITAIATGTGTTNAEKFLNAGVGNMVSSPLSGQTIADFLTSPANVNNIETNAAGRGMMDYDPLMDMWNNPFTNTTEGILGGGKGYSIRLQGPIDTPVTFTGAIQVGAIPISTVMEQWNCVGNPYTSGIGINSNAKSAANFLTVNAANLDPMYGIYVWDKSKSIDGSTGQYTAYSNVPSLTYTGSEFLPGQAFMVKMNSTSTAVNFTNLMQIHTTGVDSTQAIWPTIKLVATVNSLRSSTIVAFNSAMTNGLDLTYDAGLFKDGSDLALYTRLVADNGFSFAIQALPDNEYETLSVPVGIDSKVGGEVVFSAESFKLPAIYVAFLEDKLNSTLTDLSIKTYTTTIDPNTSAFDRFVLHTLFATGIKNGTLAGQLSAWSIRNTEIRVTGSISKSAIATLYDLQGKVVLIKNLEEGNINSILTPNLKSGIYVLSVKDNQQVQRFKIPVTE